jgi:hypothetical protein
VNLTVRFSAKPCAAVVVSSQSRPIHIFCCRGKQTKACFTAEGIVRIVLGTQTIPAWVMPNRSTYISRRHPLFANISHREGRHGTYQSSDTAYRADTRHVFATRQVSEGHLRTFLDMNRMLKPLHESQPAIRGLREQHCVYESTGGTVLSSSKSSLSCRQSGTSAVVGQLDMSIRCAESWEGDLPV